MGIMLSDFSRSQKDSTMMPTNEGRRWSGKATFWYSSKHSLVFFWHQYRMYCSSFDHWFGDLLDYVPENWVNWIVGPIFQTSYSIMVVGSWTVYCTYIEVPALQKNVIKDTR